MARLIVQLLFDTIPAVRAQTPTSDEEKSTAMGIYTDFSQLKTPKHEKAAVPPPAPEPSPTPETRALKAAVRSEDYFASLLGPAPAAHAKKAAPTPARPRTTIVTPNTIARVREEQAAAVFEAEKAVLQTEIDKLKEDLEIEKLVKDSFAQDKAAALQDLAAARQETEDVRRALAAAQKEVENVRAEAAAERARHQLELDAAHHERDDVQTQLDALKNVQTERRGGETTTLLAIPTTLSEKFPGEIREHLLEALADALSTAESGGRDRRARLLEAVLCANPLSGELEKRRQSVRRIVREAGSKLDDAVLAQLQKLGFRYVSGNKHHKIEWAGIRFPVSKTPSDHRACLNSATEINNRAF